jgi:hypothetical protein
MKRAINVAPNRIKEMVAPNPQSMMYSTSCSINIESIILFLPPKRDGVIKKPREIIKTRRHPDQTPGRLKGKKTFRNVWNGDAPKV